MAYSDYGSTTSIRPDRPLLVKCSLNGRNKRIFFNSAKTCSYDDLKGRVEAGFSLSACTYSIAYKDDDGEVTDITTEADLTEAIQYFQAGVDDLPISSAASILSGRSFGGRRITLRVHINVEYDGPSLSDTSSLASVEEYQNREGSEYSLSFSSPGSVEQDDDAVTVSSRDMGGKLAKGPKSPLSGRTPNGNQRLSVQSSNVDSSFDDLSLVDGTARSGPNDSEYVSVEHAEVRYPADPSAVFERLKLSEASRSGSATFLNDSELSSRWLRDQKAHVLTSLGASGDLSSQSSTSDRYSLAIPSEAGEDFAGQSDIDRDLALQKDQRGKYYYTYTAPSASTSQGHDELSQSDGVTLESERMLKPEPSPQPPNTGSSSRPLPRSVPSDPLPVPHFHIHPDIPPEVLQYVPQSVPPAYECRSCSSCGVTLDTIRYVCSTCGEKHPITYDSTPDSPVSGGMKGKARAEFILDSNDAQYPPIRHRTSSSPTTSSWTTAVGSEFDKPLPKLPSPTNGHANGLSRSSSSNGSSTSLHEKGYELCSSCIESAGVLHALHAMEQNGGGLTRTLSSDSNAPPSPEETLSQWRRSAPKQKGNFRHAYIEKVWGPTGWTDVEHVASDCSICGNSVTSQCYKCVSCAKFDLCRSCYSQVHDIHPSHAFLVIMERLLMRSQSEPELSQIAQMSLNEDVGERSLKHPGVKCSHCLLDIVGARFHCAICADVDICSNCESAGLPGNLEAPDGGHDSSHIMIKIPLPINATDMENASKRVRYLWQEQRVGHPLPSSSMSDLDTRTVIGATSHIAHTIHMAEQNRSDDHHIHCNGCGRNIYGVRFQCGNCSSSPSSYNLCSSCERRSYILHDPHHIFFKLPRPVDHPIEDRRPILPLLYASPAGPPPDFPATNDLTEYLLHLSHSAALCDKCMDRVQGQWFHCVYCAKDLCQFCEELDEHDSKHFFMVFKSTVNMQDFRRYAELYHQNDRPPPILSYPVYH